MKRTLSVIVFFLGVIGMTNLSASLTPVNEWTGNIGYSTDGFGSTSQSGTISASVPAGSTVLAAYLFTSVFTTAPSSIGDGTTLDGNVVSFGAIIINPGANLAMRRADVTSIVKPVIDGGAGGDYDFSVVETSGSQDGEGLVVVYENATLPEASFVLIEGFTAPAGDTATINFADPINTLDPGFFAEMVLGIGFSFPPQSSQVTINGTLITENAGGFDDGEGANGALITVGGFDDPFSPMLPSYDDDHERYNIVPQIGNGDTSIEIFTRNPSSDDNIFFAGFFVSGKASINPPPPSNVDVPTLSEWGRIALVAMFLGFSVFFFRRQQQRI